MRLVCLHALTRDRHDFAPFLPAVSDLAPLALDALGHGEAPHGQRYRVADYADYTGTQLPDGPLILYGHSLGGQIATYLAARDPGRFVGLVLEDPPLLSPLRRGEPSQFRRGFEGLRRLMTGRGKGFTAADWCDATRHWPSGHGETTIVEAMGEAAALRRGHQIANLDVATLDPPIDGTLFDGFDPIASLRGAGCPITILAGETELGGAIAVDDVPILAAEPGVSVVPARGHGHYIREADPAFCEAAVRALIASRRAAEGAAS